jgi:tRNA nucleotidyltransferase (CCA-adding enzyme)
MNRIGAPKDLIEEVKHLVAEHMLHVHAGEMTATVVRRLANRIGNHTTIEQVSRVMESDTKGRLPSKQHPCLELLTLAKELDVENAKPQPVLTGKHLLEMGFKPGKQMGDMLKKVFELQLDGTLSTLDEMKAWVVGNN